MTETLVQLRENLYPEVRSALEKEYGSLEEALKHFQRRFKNYAPRIMAEKNPRYLDPIIINPVNGKAGVSFWKDHSKGPWALTEPRRGGMAHLLTKQDLLDIDKPTPKIRRG